MKPRITGRTIRAIERRYSIEKINKHNGHIPRLPLDGCSFVRLISAASRTSLPAPARQYVRLIAKTKEEGPRPDQVPAADLPDLAWVRHPDQARAEHHQGPAPAAHRQDQA